MSRPHFFLSTDYQFTKTLKRFSFKVTKIQLLFR